MRWSRIVLALMIVAAAGVAIGVAAVVRQRRRLAAPSDAEVRSLLQEKLSGRVADEQLATIQEAVLTKLRGTPQPSQG